MGSVRRLILALGLTCIASAAHATCSGPGGTPFNCTKGNAPTLNDIVTGGSNTSPQSGQAVRWTWAQVKTLFAFGNGLPLATTSQLYGGTGTAGTAGVVGVGSGCTLSGSVLSCAGTPTTTLPFSAITGTATNAQIQGSIGFEVDFFQPGVPGASAHLNRVFSRATVVAASAPIKCSAQEGATSSATVTLNHVVSGTVTAIGGLTFAASGSAYQNCTAVFPLSVTFAVGDVLTAVFPGTADATLGDIAISIPATQ
jgi:hypothetical protein